MDLRAYTEAIMHLSSRRLRIPFEDGMKGKQFREPEDKRNVESEAGKAHPEDTSVDGLDGHDSKYSTVRVISFEELISKL